MQKGSRPGQAKAGKEKEVLEAGFSNYFSGANHERALQKNKELRERSKSRGVQKKSDEKPKRGWQDYTQDHRDRGSQNTVRVSADRYSQHSEDEEVETHNKWAQRKMDKNRVAALPPQPRKTPGSRPIYEDQLDFAKYTIRPKDEGIVLQEFQETGRNFAKLDVQGLSDHYEVIKQSMMELKNEELDILKESFIGMHLAEHPDQKHLVQKFQHASDTSTDPHLDKKDKIKVILSTIKQNMDNPDFIGALFDMIKHGPSKPNFVKTMPTAKEQQVPEHRVPRPTSKTSMPEAPKKPNFRITSATSTSKEHSYRPDTGEHYQSSHKPSESCASRLPHSRVKHSQEIGNMGKVEDDFLESMDAGGQFQVQAKPEFVHADKPEKSQPTDNLNLDFFLDDEPAGKTKVQSKQHPEADRKPVEPEKKLPEKTKPAEKPKEPTAGPIAGTKVADSLFESAFDGGSGAALIHSHNTIVIRVKSALGGDGKEIGLTRVKLFDIAGHEIPLQPKDVSVAGCSPSVTQRLVVADPVSAKPSDLFKMEFPLLSSFVDIKLKYYGPDPGHLRIWNYFADRSAGCKDLEVLINGGAPILFKLFPGVYSRTGDYYQDLQLAPEAIIDGKRSEPPKDVNTVPKEDVASSKNYEILFGDDAAMNTSPSKTSVGSRGRRRAPEANVQITVKKTAQAAGVDIDVPVFNDDRPAYVVPKEKPELQLEENHPPKDISRRVPANPKTTGGDYRSRRDEMKQKHMAVDPIIDNLSEFVRAHGQKDSHTHHDSRKDHYPQGEFRIGDSQLVKIDLEESQIIEPPAAYKNSKPLFKPKDPMDALDFQLDNLRKFNKKNMSRIELSGLDLSTVAPKTTALVQQVIPNSTALASKPVQHKPYEVHEMFNYKSFEEVLEQNEMFFVPELPKGRTLDFDLFSTWGDKFYMGLCGIEVFDGEGRPVRIDSSGVSAEPANLNVLPEVTDDPRTADKLVDGEYNTADDLHCWMAPVSQAKPNRIRIDLGQKTTISLIRIWNYNKNRVHTARGVKEVCIKLDGMLMFFGMIGKASGDLKEPASNAEWLVFCQEQLFSKIEQHDWLTRSPRPEKPQSAVESIQNRPTTSSGKSEAFDKNKAKDISDIKRQLEIEKQKLIELEKETQERKRFKEAAALANKTTSCIECVKLSISVVENWGDPHFAGLTGIEFYDEDKQPIRLAADSINASPRDLNTELQNNDKRRLENLLNGENVTTAASNMWLTQYSKHSKTLLFVNFGDRRKISGMRVWNFNQSEADSYRGIKKIEITADLNKITSGFVYLRKAPGRDDVDFSQFVPFPPPKSRPMVKSTPEPSEILNQLSLPPRFPTGYCLRFNLMSTWGDSYYIGLDRLEVYDRLGKPLMLAGRQNFKLHASPSDITVLPGVSSDSRVVENLSSDAAEGKSWLAPFINPHGSSKSNLGYSKNELFVVFQEPVTIGCLKFWNYSKTPARGVKELEVYLDDCIIFSVISA